MKMMLAGGNVAERLLRNRGRMRALAAAWNVRCLRQNLRRFLAGEWKPKAGRRESHYSISLTSWSVRLDDLQLTLVSLINQDVRPSAIFVWLTPEDLDLLPDETVRRFEASGVRFKESPDFRSHKKWLPLVLSGHRGPFVVCDDDIIYPREWFSSLISEDREDSYVGCKCHRIVLEPDGMPAPYDHWDRQVYFQKKPGHLLFTTGCGGEILHPDRLEERALDWDEIKRISPHSDDVWLKWAHQAAGFPVFKTRYSFPCLEIPGTNASGLMVNHNNDKKDVQIRAVWDYFGISLSHFRDPVPHSDRAEELV